MSYVEIETGRYIKRWAFWNPATWSIPKLYWDAWSQEQRLHAICRQLEKVIKYADYLGVNVDDIAARLKAIEEGQLNDFIVAAIEAWFEENQPGIISAIDALNESLPIEDFDSENTVSDAINALNVALPLSNFDSENTVSDAIASTNASISEISDAIETIEGSLKEYELPDRVNGAKVMCRTFREPNYGLQGMCVWPESNPIYAAIGKASSLDPALGAVDIYEIPTNTRIGSVSGSFYHATDITYDNGKLYVAAGGDAPIVNVIDVTTPSTPFIDDIINFSSQGMSTVFGFGRLDDDNFYYIDWPYQLGKIYKVNASTFAIDSELCRVPIVEGLYQAISYNKYFNCFMILSSQFSNITFFDLEGKVFRSCGFERQYGFVPVGELEAVCATDKAIYFSNNPTENKTSSQVLHGAIWKFSFDENYSNFEYTTRYAACQVYVKLTDAASGMNTENFVDGRQFAGINNTYPIMIKYPEDLPAIPMVAGTGNRIQLDICNDVSGIIPIMGGSWIIEFDDAAAAYKIPGIYVSDANATFTRIAQVPFADVEQVTASEATLIQARAAVISLINGFTTDVSATAYVATIDQGSICIHPSTTHANNIRINSGGVSISSGSH